MNIKTKCDIGDTVFVIRLKEEKEAEICPVCGGSGEVQVVGFDGKMYPCGLCDGMGYFKNGKYKVKHFIKKYEVFCVEIKINGLLQDTIIEYFYRESFGHEYETRWETYSIGLEKDIFATYEEAEEELKRREKLEIDETIIHNDNEPEE